MMDSTNQLLGLLRPKLHYHTFYKYFAGSLNPTRPKTPICTSYKTNFAKPPNLSYFSDQHLSGFRGTVRSLAMATGELACTYAALILQDDGITITSEKISTIVKAANLKIDSYWPALFSKLLERRSVEDLILSAGSGGGAAPVNVSAAPAGGSNAASAAAVPTVEEKKEEPKEESDDDMGFSLFD